MSEAMRTLSAQPKRRFKPYPAYKDSGVEWLGEIPAHWEMGRLKMMLDLSREKNGAEPVGEMLSVSGYRGVEPKEYDFEERKRSIEDLADYRVVRVGQLVVNTMWLNYAGLGVSSFEGHVSPAYRCYKITHRYEGGYLHHLMRSVVYVGRYCSLLYGIRPNSLQIKNHDWDSLELLVPPISEQRAIAAFLDRETAKIDALVAKKERLIELLQEKRTALITRAVTKGLDPTVPMKDSGVEWLGEIPAHWTLGPLFTVARECHARNTGSHETNVLSLSYGRIVRRDTSNNFGLLPESFDTYQIVEPGNIVLRLTDLQNDKRSLRVGFVGERGIITSAYVALTVSHGLTPEYAAALLHAYDVCKVFYSLGGGVRQTMKFEDLKWMPLVIPPEPEQRAIAAFLDRETAKIDALIAKVREAIDRLKELRTALISAAVTGKIDVREETL